MVFPVLLLPCLTMLVRLRVDVENAPTEKADRNLCKNVGQNPEITH